MGVDEIIDEIKQLPRQDQLAVADFVMDITGRSTPVSGEKLEMLASRLAETADESERERLKEKIHKGFYGTE